MSKDYRKFRFNFELILFTDGKAMHLNYLRNFKPVLSSATKLTLTPPPAHATPFPIELKLNFNLS